MTKKMWFITGASRGFGRHWAEAALQRGDLVAATARDTSSLTGLVATYGDAVLPLQLDVTDQAAVRETLAQAHKTFGRIDVVVNNAGYGLAGPLEEASEEQARALMETNFFGAFWVTQAVLPYMREQGSGHIVQVSSIGGVVTYPGWSLYHASKFALEGASEALAQKAILAVVDAPNPPLRLFLGVGLLDAARTRYEQRLKTWEQWEEVARAAL